MKKSVKIPVHHYVEINKVMTVDSLIKRVHAIVNNDQTYITNKNGKTYIVEVWA
jgi:hypothetical protein